MEDNDPDTHIYSNTTNFLASSCVADFLHGCNFVPTFTIKKRLHATGFYREREQVRYMV